MWCSICKKDVAAEIVGNDDPRCSYCGTAISSGMAARPRTRTQKARDLLEKWSHPQLAEVSTEKVTAIDPLEKAVEASSPIKAASVESTPVEKNLVESTSVEMTPEKVPASKPAPRVQESISKDATAKPVTSNLPVFRFDQPHPTTLLSEMNTEFTEKPVIEEKPSETTAKTTPTTEKSLPAKIQQPDLQLHSAHREVPEPHFQIPAETEFVEETAESSMNLLAGYMLSYLGILGLLTGTVLVVIGYFKGPLNYMPMGWIINAFGQLLLFLGIVTLVTSKLDRLKSSLIAEFHYVRQHLKPKFSDQSVPEKSTSAGTVEKKSEIAA